MENRNLQKFSFYISLIGSLCSIISLIMVICPDLNNTSFIINFLVEYCPYISLVCCVSCYVTYNFFIPKYKVTKQDIPTEEAKPSHIFNFFLAIIFTVDLFIIISMKYSYAGNGGEYADAYFKLLKSYDELQQSYDDSEKSYDELKKSYDKLQQLHVGLQQSYDSIIHTCSELLQSTNELKNSYNDLQLSYNELEDKYTTLMEENSLLKGNISLQDIISNLEETEGINDIESYALLTYVNQYRTEAGIPKLSWNPELANYAKNYATQFATNQTPSRSNYLIGYQSKSDKNAQEAVLYFMRGDESSANDLLNADFTQMGGALYYLLDGNEEGYCYFWFICLL